MIWSSRGAAAADPGDGVLRVVGAAAAVVAGPAAAPAPARGLAGLVVVARRPARRRRSPSSDESPSAAASEDLRRRRPPRRRRRRRRPSPSPSPASSRRRLGRGLLGGRPRRRLFGLLRRLLGGLLGGLLRAASSPASRRSAASSGPLRRAAWSRPPSWAAFLVAFFFGFSRVGDLEEHRRRPSRALVCSRRAARRPSWPRSSSRRPSWRWSSWPSPSSRWRFLAAAFLAAAFLAAVFAVPLRRVRRSRGRRPWWLPARWWSRPRACTAPRPGCPQPGGHRRGPVYRRAASSLQWRRHPRGVTPSPADPAAVACPSSGRCHRPAGPRRGLASTGLAAENVVGSTCGRPVASIAQPPPWQLISRPQRVADLAGRPRRGPLGQPGEQRVRRPARARPRGQSGEHVVGPDGRLEVAQHQVERGGPSSPA